MAKYSYTSFGAWNAAVFARGLTFESPLGDGPCEHDPYEPTFAVNKEGNVVGWCALHPDGDRMDAFLFDSAGECEAWIDDFFEES